MVSAAHMLRRDPLAGEEGETFLGPARVVEVAGATVIVDLRPGRVVSAIMALAFPYVPSVDDVLLVIGRGEEHYVIGVIKGSGKTSLAFQGDVDLSASAGVLTLSSDKAVKLSGPEVQVQARELRAYAGEVIGKFTSVVQRVAESLHLRAGSTQTVVRDSAVTTAKTATILTEETMTINGQAIHLG